MGLEERDGSDGDVSSMTDSSGSFSTTGPIAFICMGFVGCDTVGDSMRCSAT